jgi:hypothetical protein
MKLTQNGSQVTGTTSNDTKNILDGTVAGSSFTYRVDYTGTLGLYDLCNAQVLGNQLTGMCSSQYPRGVGSYTLSATRQSSALCNPVIDPPLAPVAGAVGTEVTITGSNFGDGQGSAVAFGATTVPSLSILSWSDTQIVVQVPDLPTGPYKVTVTTSAGQSNAVAFEVEGCAYDDRTDDVLADAEARVFEDAVRAGQGVPPDSLFPPNVEAVLSRQITAFLADLQARVGIVLHRDSGYRPSAYQKHFYDMLEDDRALEALMEDIDTQKQACAVLRAKIDKELAIHGLSQANGAAMPGNSLHEKRRDNHPEAQAVDLAPKASLITPPATLPSGTPSLFLASPALFAALIDSIAAEHGLWRPVKSDVVHFALLGSPTLQQLTALMKSPVNMMIHDPLGRRFGFDPATGTVINEIGAGTFYTGPGTEPQRIDVGGALAGTYTVTGIGTGVGPYTLTLSRMDEDGEILETQEVTGIASLGQPIAPLGIQIVTPVPIDVFPGKTLNIFDPGRRLAIPVAILTTETFDAARVALASLGFGPSGAMIHDKKRLLQDVNGDGLLDLVVRFELHATGMQCSDVTASLTGQTVDGEPIEGVDALIAQVPGDLNGDCHVNCFDFAIVKAAFGQQSGQPGFDPRADTNSDGVVKAEDWAFVTQQLPAGTSCDVQTPGGGQTNHPPVANAGPDQSVNAGTAVTLNSAGSSDLDGDPLTFRWAQTAGPTVILNTANSATPTFTAPNVSTDTTLTFQLIVNDGTTDSKPAQVTVAVKALPIGGGQTPGGEQTPSEPQIPTETQTPGGSQTASDPQTPIGTRTSSGGGGGCTLNSGAEFDPMIGGMIGLLMVPLIWQRLRKCSLYSRR